MMMKPKQKKKNTPQVSKSKPQPGSVFNKGRLTLGLIIAAIGFLLYSNTFSHGYVLDDFSAVKENNIVRQGIPAIPEIFKTSYRQGYLSVKDGLYRPLSLAMYAIEWDYFPDQPGVSHIVNVLLYALTGYLLFLMLCRLFTSPLTPLPSGEGRKQPETIAFVASLLFISHPLHVEVVANIKSRDEILCFLFSILCFISAFKYLDTGKLKFLAAGAISYFLSLLSKETSITLLALLPLALHFFSATPMKKIIAVTAVFICTAGVYLAIRHSVLEGAMADAGVSVADNVIVGAKTVAERIGTAFFILGLYLKLLVFPHPLSYDYSFNHIPVVGMGNILSLASLLFYLSIGIFAAFILWKSLRDKSQIPSPKSQVAFGIFFFLITIFLFSNLVLTIGTSMGDRLMYFPSLGFCIVIAALIVKYMKIDLIDTTQIMRNAKLIPVLIVVLLFSYKTYSRNVDWKNNYTLYTHDVEIVPNSVKAHYYLGLELIKSTADTVQDPVKKEKIYAQGIRELERSVEIMPTFGNSFTQMGVAYYRLKNFEKAIENYNKATSLKAADAITSNNIGSVYFEWKKYPEATEYFKRALQIDPRFVDAHMNLGSVYGTLNDFNNALACFGNAVKYAPDNARAYYYMGITYQNHGDKANADKYYEIAARMDPRLVRPK